MMKEVSLDGEWRLKYSTGMRGRCQEWPQAQRFVQDYAAQVPGTVHEAMRHLTGDLNEGHNLLNARWIEEMMWNYSRTFELSEQDAAKKIRLVFEGLDLTSQIFVNEKSAGKHNNFYTPCRLDITGMVTPGENRLSVNIESGVIYGNKKAVQTGYCPEADGRLGGILGKKVWLRKPQSSFEMDWSPQLLNVGIYKSCRIEITNGVFADEQSIFATLSDDYRRGHVRIRQFLYNNNDGIEYSVTVKVLETGDCAVVSGQLPFGSQCAELELDVANPRLWYPRNYGPQNLYTLEIVITQADSEDIVIRKHFGFRNVVVDQSRHPKEGNYFTLSVNGIKVFAKGSNFIPPDILASRFTTDVNRKLIELALEANFNMFRIWGGGLYGTDDFYELCDRFGIMVWQDFISDGSAYPGFDVEFADNYNAEITYEIRRLSRFPSLVVYAGNNEVGWLGRKANQGINYPDAQLYEWLLPKTLRAEGESRYYQPTSPYSFDYTDDNSDIVGDQHPWFIGFSSRDYFLYRTKECRFAVEGGILGPTSLPNMMKCFSPGQDFLHSFDWELHENSIAHGEKNSPDLMLNERFDMNPAALTVRDYVYYGGFCQGEALTEYILNFRRRMFSSSGALFWMYNDCWPMVRSWTIVDYLRNRTPSFHPVRRSFAPVAVDIVKEDSELVFYGINERLKELPAVLEYGAFTPDGKYLTYSKNVNLAPNCSIEIVRMPIPEAGFIPYAELKAEGEPVARRRFIESKYSELGLVKCDISIEHRGTKAIYRADKLVLGVCIDLNGNAPIGDNFFDLFPNKPYEVELGSLSGEVL
ncbi:MAG: hypothetical protein J5746_11870, partial [Victivallales bacterium]|nr:hypothetical protein [Victivallales bacterium]